MNVAIAVLIIVVVGGAIIAVIWWGLADKLFPGTAAKTGQGLPRPKPDRKAGATIVKSWDGSGPSDSR